MKSQASGPTNTTRPFFLPFSIESNQTMCLPFGRLAPQFLRRVGWGGFNTNKACGPLGDHFVDKFRHV